MSIVQDTRQRLQHENMSELSRKTGIDHGNLSKFRRGIIGIGAERIERLVTLGLGLDIRICEPGETLADARARHLAGDAALHAIVTLDDRMHAEAAIRAELHAGPDRDGLRLGAVFIVDREKRAAVQPK